MQLLAHSNDMDWTADGVENAEMATIGTNLPS
jgi:hypothetical protein